MPPLHPLYTPFTPTLHPFTPPLRPLYTPHFIPPLHPLYTSLQQTGNNQGDTRIKPYPQHGRCRFFCTPRISMVTLDDLTSACHFSKAIMKVDIQGYAIY